MKITIKNLCSINNARVAVTTASLALLLVFTACSENGFSEDGASGASTKGSVVSSIVAYLPGSDSKALKKSAASIDANDMHTVATVYEDDTLANQIKVSWEENDAFNVTNGSDTVKFAAHGIKATGNATEFKPLNEEDEIVCSDDKSCTAIYPKMIMDASDEGVKNYLLSKESQGRTINVNKSKEDQNKFDELWKQNVMTSQVTKQGDKYVVHFEHKVALVDISIKFGEATTINEIGIYGPRGEKYFATILDDSKDVSYKANETAKAVIAVPPFALKEKDNLTVFVTKSDDSVVRYKRKLVKDVKFELGQYYALSFDKENIALDHEYIDGVEVVDMGHCGLWAKEDFAKNGKYYFAKGYGSVSEKIYYDWDLYSYLRKKPETLTGLPHWEVPTTGDFENLYDCEASVADDGSVTFVSVSDTVHLGKATYSTSVGGFWISSSYGFVYYVSASNEWLEESVLPILHRVPHRIHLVPVVAGTCSGKLYTEDQFCLDGVITEKCGGETYSDDQFCLNDVVKEKCNGETYADDKFCDNNKLYDKCGGEQFSTAREFCLDGV
ncbi:MAG: hypothetical protein HUK20_02395, partial [Fibrobacter sp.]|nr:hypothetical protein [Fibrobacter sp.]